MRNLKSRKLENSLFLFFVYAFLFLSIGILSFFFLFLAKESLPLFESVSLPSFLFSSKWNPMAFTGTASFGIFHFLMGSISVSFLALVLHSFVSGLQHFLRLLLLGERKTHPLPSFGLTFRHSFRGLRLYRFNGRKTSLSENGREYRLLYLTGFCPAFHFDFPIYGGFHHGQYGEIKGEILFRGKGSGTSSRLHYPKADPPLFPSQHFPRLPAG